MKASEGDVPNSEPGWESSLLSRDTEFSKAGTLPFTDAEEMTLSPFHKKTKFKNYGVTCPSLHLMVLILFIITFNGPISSLAFHLLSPYYYYNHQSVCGLPAFDISFH